MPVKNSRLLFSKNFCTFVIIICIYFEESIGDDIPIDRDLPTVRNYTFPGDKITLKVVHTSPSNVEKETHQDATHLPINRDSKFLSSRNNLQWDRIPASSVRVSVEQSLSSQLHLNEQMVRNRNVLRYLDEMLEGYDKRAWPTFDDDTPTFVEVSVHVNTLGPVNAAQMEFGMDIYLRQKWKDPRLNISKYGVTKTITLNANGLIDQIWKPDLFFRNVKDANFHKVTVPNKLIKFMPGGDILYSSRITLRLACHMSFRHYPLDTQHCQVVIGSYAQTADQVLFSWRENNPISIEPRIELPEFDVQDMKHSTFMRSIETGNFSFLNVTFAFVRQNGFHLIQTYLPTCLIVMVSWVSFWLNVDSVPARITLGITTLLTLTTVSHGVRMQLPPVSYVKAIDVWIGVCSVMVFGALLEFTLINYVSRSKLKLSQLKRPISIFHWNKKLDMESDTEDTQATEERIANNLKRARSVDRFSRVLFPMAFLIFNVFYWLYYLCIPDSKA